MKNQTLFVVLLGILTLSLAICCGILGYKSVTIESQQEEITAWQEAVAPIFTYRKGGDKNTARFTPAMVKNALNPCHFRQDLDDGRRVRLRGCNEFHKPIGRVRISVEFTNPEFRELIEHGP